MEKKIIRVNFYCKRCVKRTTKVAGDDRIFCRSCEKEMVR